MLICNRYGYLIVFSLLFFWSTFAFAEKGKWKTYHNPQYQFSLKYPETVNFRLDEDLELAVIPGTTLKSKTLRVSIISDPDQMKTVLQEVGNQDIAFPWQKETIGHIESFQQIMEEPDMGGRFYIYHNYLIPQKNHVLDLSFTLYSRQDMSGLEENRLPWFDEAAETKIFEKILKSLSFSNAKANSDGRMVDPDQCLEQATTQTAINTCNQTAYQQAEKALNQTYQRILKEYASDKEFLKRLRQAQRAWIGFRDNHMKSLYPKQYKASDYGRGFPFCLNQELYELTNARVKQLQKWLDGADEGDVCAGSIKFK